MIHHGVLDKPTVGYLWKPAEPITGVAVDERAGDDHIRGTLQRAACWASQATTIELVVVGHYREGSVGQVNSDGHVATWEARS